MTMSLHVSVHSAPQHQLKYFSILMEKLSCITIIVLAGIYSIDRECKGIIFDYKLKTKHNKFTANKIT